MDTSSAPIQVGTAHFDLAQVANVISLHPEMAAIVAAVGYVFWISRKNGLAGSWFAFRATLAELESKRLDTHKALTIELESRAIETIGNVPKPSTFALEERDKA